jgi:quinohemoprotein ethanol dehydrogenase
MIPTVPLAARLRFLAGVAAGLAVWLGPGHGFAQPAPGPDDRFSAAALTAAPRASWPTNGGNLYNQRYSPLTGIDRDNVARLAGVWRTSLGGSGVDMQYSASAQPLVDDGVAYLITGANDVFALSVESGEILWQYTADLNPDLTSVCCGWTSRGVGLSADKVFVGRLDARLVALDRASGEVIWDVEAEPWEQNFSITSAPLYYDGMVITGFAGADRGTRGRVKAFSAEDGRLLWTFYTIPGPGEPGHETWPADNDAWRYGGASVWQTPALDPELGLLYFSTGNAGPNYNGAARAGDNLFTVSIVAIEAATGDYRWHFQQVHHDIWDYDASNPVVLMDLDIDGRTRRALVEVGKTGFAYILDRATGEPIIGIEERPVPQEPSQATAATQPFPIGDPVVPQRVDIAPEGVELVNDGRIFTPFVGDNPVIVKPGAFGGANWPPSAYDPERQRLYVCATSAIGNYWGGGDIEVVPPGQGERYVGGNAGFARTPRTGIFAALDMTSNRLVWQYRWPEQCYSGSAATAGGLVFVGRNDGRLTALDADTGMQLWEFQTGAGMHAPVSVFEHDGRPYVIAYAGGNRLAGSTRGDSVWLFGLDGALQPAGSSSPATRASGGANAAPQPAGVAANVTVVAGVAGGEQLYALQCAACHGADGRGGPAGPTLAQAADLEAVTRIVSDGLNHMPAFGASLTREQIRAVGAHVVEHLSAGAAAR